MRQLILLFCSVSIASCVDFVDLACDRNPNRPYCRHALGAVTSHAREPREEKLTQQDKVACQELRQEYVDQCAKSSTNGRGEPEFCQAFENICFRVHKNDPDQETLSKGRSSKVESELDEIDAKESEEQKSQQKEPSAPADTEDSHPASSTNPERKKKKKKKRINFTEFCKEFKNRYLYVCPDPFRFGQKAVVFCPIYSEHCHVPLPDKPVVPTKKSKKRGSVQRMCASYRNRYTIGGGSSSFQ